ncbi:MAG TPA: PIN domain-containing protein [Polyangia bacterium]|nr:PIN domain-containing protein [Polyangia bacterium]
MGRAFLDTNVLVYADDADAGAKRVKAQALLVSALTTGDAVISTQVLQEYFSVATRKLSVTADAAQKKVEILAALVAVTIDADHVIESIKLHRLYDLSFWDALILHAARRAGCDRLMTEDLQAGQKIEGVEIVDPFA